MTALDVFLTQAHGVATVLTLCFAQPGHTAPGRGCVTYWEAPGRQMVECRIRAMSVRSDTADRTHCSVVPLDRERAGRLLAAWGTCRKGEGGNEP